MSEENFMLSAKSRRTRILRILSVPRLISFVSQSTAYAADADKKAREKPRTKTDYVLTQNQLRLLKANDASFRAVVEKMNRKTKIKGIVTIPETEKISITIAMVDKAPRNLRMRSFPVTDRFE
jgi:hypothetical protein